MPRKARERSSTDTYHVMVRGLNKLPVFRQTREKYRLLKLITESLDEYEVQIFAYCIMSNHFHLLINAELEVLSSFMAKILAAYAKYYNFKHHRIGYVFQDRYKSQCAETEKYFWNCMRYIHLNPVKGNYCKQIHEYKFSSMHEYYSNSCKILDESAFEGIGIRFQGMSEFLEFHKMNSRDLFDDIQDDMEMQKQEIGRDILREIQQKTKLPAAEILEYGKTRAQLQECLRQVLHISKKEADSIQEKLRLELGTG